MSERQNVCMRAHKVNQRLKKDEVMSKLFNNFIIYNALEKFLVHFISFWVP